MDTFNFNRLDVNSADSAQLNLDALYRIAPSVFTEAADPKTGKVSHKVDFEALRRLLGDNVMDEDGESYQFTWVGKNAAKAEAARSTDKTLRPVPEDSVDWDNTKNLYIEGDNLEVLKLLQRSYLGKVKMIYIDPPYNTGNDFVYGDDFSRTAAEEDLEAGNVDELGLRYRKNTDSNGKFHSDWCSMIYPRLLVARSLLTEDGVIFISIDDNEQKNLKNICDEVFGSSNFLAQVVWERAYSPINLMKHFSPSHDYILCYARNIEQAVCNGIPRSAEADSRYSNPDNDPRGVWKSSDLSVGPAVEENIYTITTPSGRNVEPPAGRSWRLSRKAFRERLQDNRIWFGPDGNSVPSMKRFLSELRKTGITPMTIWKYTEVDHSQGATQKLAKLFDGKKVFDYPKPVELIKRAISLYADKDSIILDFFSGSSTTAQAVMELNANDDGKRKFIMVQLQEEFSESSDGYKMGFKTICDAAKERIRRAGKKIKEESPLTTQDLDIGFRVLKLDSTNMEDIYYAPSDINQANLFSLVDNVKPDRTPEDLLFQVMLELGATLDSKIEHSLVDGKTVWNVADGYIVACFDKDVTDDVVKVIAKMQPQYAVLRDTSMANDSTATNFEQIFKTYSPNTTTKIL